MLRFHLVERQSRKEAQEPPAEHLPWRIRTGALIEIADKACQCADQKACFRSQRNAGDDNHRCTDLDRDRHMKQEMCRHRQRRHHRDQHDFSGFRFAALKNHKKRDHRIDHNQKSCDHELGTPQKPKGDEQCQRHRDKQQGSRNPLALFLRV